MQIESLDGPTLPVAYAEDVSPAELREWRQRLGLTQERLARELDVTFTTVWRWEHGKRPVPGMVTLALSELERRQQEGRAQD